MVGVAAAAVKLFRFLWCVRSLSAMESGGNTRAIGGVVRRAAAGATRAPGFIGIAEAVVDKARRAATRRLRPMGADAFTLKLPLSGSGVSARRSAVVGFVPSAADSQFQIHKI